MRTVTSSHDSEFERSRFRSGAQTHLRFYLLPFIHSPVCLLHRQNLCKVYHALRKACSPRVSPCDISIPTFPALRSRRARPRSCLPGLACCATARVCAARRKCDRTPSSVGLLPSPTGLAAGTWSASGAGPRLLPSIHGTRDSAYHRWGARHRVCLGAVVRSLTPQSCARTHTPR